MTKFFELLSNSQLIIGPAKAKGIGVLCLTLIAILALFLF